MELESGRLDRLLRLERPPTEAERELDPFGEPVAEWVTLKDRVPAERRDVRASEGWQTQQLAAHVEIRFRLRWLPSVTPTCRVVDLSDSDAIYAIQGVLELGRREGLELICTRRAE